MRVPTLLLFVALGIGSSCSGGRVAPPDWLPATPDARADFDTFAVRCSKCHSLARPLSSGIDDDEYWRIYVDKMRRQPDSGISPTDAMAVSRFLHLYAIEQRRRKGIAADNASTSPP